MAQIIPIALPTPYMVGDVNVFFIDDERPMLIDAGPPTCEAYRILTERLQALGCPVTALKEIVVTHFHPDHVGLAQVLAKEAGIPVRLHPLDLYTLRLGSEKASGFFDGWNLPPNWDPKQFDTRHWIPEKYRPAGVTFQPLEDGETIVTGSLRFDVLDTPGHSLGHVALWEQKNRWLFTGDTVIPGLAPNPFIYHVEGERVPTLPMYLKSLDRLRHLDAAILYPGHGDPVTDLAAELNATVDHYRQKALEVHAIVREQGPSPLHEIAARLYPRQIESQPYMVMSKTLGCLDLLERAGLVRSQGANGFYQAAGESEKKNPAEALDPWLTSTR
ncbi:metallo-beta-lactamase family protein [Heliomicrobium modesticaldum Ice1]|uniref:Metallo-beta-lactamase family protein n=1 Tax=Heliobacterium modesticaldum (strain ATCC 51547 / Ice1) TaxID=498761 RepID=B0TI42_HELMI|nr:MBL fold metallo-hydrolase [Heliomicrobium modesticaldum]ABZ82715.1 metallo-beta-lactamase family protein [Heliomicrobium modesticaldum Ice1]